MLELFVRAILADIALEIGGGGGGGGGGGRGPGGRMIICTEKY